MVLFSMLALLLALGFVYVFLLLFLEISRLVQKNPWLTYVLLALLVMAAYKYFVR